MFRCQRPTHLTCTARSARPPVLEEDGVGLRGRGAGVRDTAAGRRRLRPLLHGRARRRRRADRAVPGNELVAGHRRELHRQEERAEAGGGRAGRGTRGQRRVRLPPPAPLVGGHAHDDRRGGCEFRRVRLRPRGARHPARRAVHHRLRGAGAPSPGREAARVRMARLLTVHRRERGDRAERAGGEGDRGSKRTLRDGHAARVRYVRRPDRGTRRLPRHARLPNTRHQQHPGPDRDMLAHRVPERDVVQGAGHRAQAHVRRQEPTFRAGDVDLRGDRRGVRGDADELPEQGAGRVQHRGGDADILRHVHDAHAHRVVNHVS